MTSERIEPFGWRELDMQMRRLEENALTVHETSFHKIHEDFQVIEAHRFGDEGPGWAPLSGVTVRHKAKKGYIQPESPLVATQDLLLSLAGNTEHTVFESRPAELTMGTNLPYARFHQVGPRVIRVWGRGSAVLPQRKVIDIGPEVRAKWAAIVQAGLTGRAHRS